MKQLLKLFPVILMVAAISVAGCGDTGEKKDGDKGGSDTSESKEDKGASNTPATDSGAASFVATKVALPNMAWS